MSEASMAVIGAIFRLDRVQREFVAASRDHVLATSDAIMRLRDLIRRALPLVENVGGIASADDVTKIAPKLIAEIREELTI